MEEMKKMRNGRNGIHYTKEMEEMKKMRNGRNGMH
jgi:hypothetical protein